MLVLLGNCGTPFCFDGYDALAPLGGEVGQLVAYGVTGTDKHAKDVEDGYSVSGLNTVRPIVTTTFAGSETGNFFLVDEGSSNSTYGGYGTLFGTVVGGISGQQTSGGAVLGPNTVTGSGKVTCWNNRGIYGVTIDALDSTLAASTSLPTATALYYTSAGKLCLTGQKVSSGAKVGTFLEWSTGDTLVTTPRSLTRIGVSGGMTQFKMAVINWSPIES